MNEGTLKESRARLRTFAGLKRTNCSPEKLQYLVCLFRFVSFRFVFHGFIRKWGENLSTSLIRLGFIHECSGEPSWEAHESRLSMTNSTHNVGSCQLRHSILVHQHLYLPLVVDCTTPVAALLHRTVIRNEIVCLP